MLLGDILLDSELVTKHQLKQALECQDQEVSYRPRRRLGDILIDLGFITPQQLSGALTQQTQLQRFQLKLDSSFLSSKSAKISRDHHSISMEPSFDNDLVQLLNLSIHNLSMEDLLQQLDEGLVFTPNVDHVMKLQKDPEFHATYQYADYRVCDSQVLLYASRFLGNPIKERISGSDFFPAFCHYHRNNPNICIFLLGSAPGVAEQAMQKINQRVGREIIIAAHSPSYGFENNQQECQELIRLINHSQATVLAIGVGSPKGENWLCKYRNQLPNIKILLGIGATIDFEAGIVKRAPKWMSLLGIEWLFRMSQDPKRLWKRYLIEDLPFLWLILQQKFGVYQSPTFGTSEKSDSNALTSQPSTPGREP